MENTVRSKNNKSQICSFHSTLLTAILLLLLLLSLLFGCVPPICLYAEFIQLSTKMVKDYWLIFVVVHVQITHTVAAFFFCNITNWSYWLTFLRYEFEVILTDNRNNNNDNVRRLLECVGACAYLLWLVVPPFSVLDAKIIIISQSFRWTFQLLWFGSFKKVVFHMLLH